MRDIIRETGCSGSDVREALKVLREGGQAVPLGPVQALITEWEWQE